MTVAIITAVFASGAIYVQRVGPPMYKFNYIDVHFEPTPERVERGARIARMLCFNCHLDPQTGRLSGKRLGDVPPIFGEIHSRNITQDPRHGVGAWRDGDLAALLRTNVRPDGAYIPFMVNLSHAADEDIAAIVCFLRSRDLAVAPAAVPSQPSRPSFLTKVLQTLFWRPARVPAHEIKTPPPGDPVRLGAYLATGLLYCYGCHSRGWASLNTTFPERSGGFFGGGTALIDEQGRRRAAPNLTRDPTGLAAWTEAEFVRALRDGVRPDGAPIRDPMQRYDALSEDEAKAIFAYLRTLPPIANAVPRAP